MKKWAWLLAFPYVVNISAKEGKCVKYADLDPAECTEKAGGVKEYRVGGIQVEDKETAEDLAAALSSGHKHNLDFQDSKSKELPPADEPIIRDR
jgi:hypothetical protein